MLRKVFNSWGFDLFLFGLVVTILGIAWHSFTPDFEDFGIGIGQIGGTILTLGLFITAIQVILSHVRRSKHNL